jgi:hypothetical protein
MYELMTFYMSIQHEQLQQAMFRRAVVLGISTAWCLTMNAA